MGGDARQTSFRSAVDLFNSGHISRREFIWRAALLGVSASVVAPLLSGCGGDDSSATTTTAAGAGGGGGELNMLVWEGYSADSVLDPFRRDHDVKVTAELITSDPDAINRLRAGDTGVFDIINVNNPWAREIMYPENLIIPLDQERFKPYFDKMMTSFAWPYHWAMSLDGEELLGMTQRFGPFNFVVNTDKVSREMAEDQGFDLFNDGANAGRYGVLTWDNWNIMHMLMGSGIDPFVDHTDEERAKFGETAANWFKNAKLKTDDMGAMNTALVNGEIDFYLTGGTYTASPARLEGHTNIRGITPKKGPSQGKSGIVWIEVTSLVNNPDLSPVAPDFLEYVQQPDISHTVAMAEGTHNPVAQMGNPDVLASFTTEELDALQWDSLEEELANSVDYDVVPDFDQLLEIYSQALRES